MISGTERGRRATGGTNAPGNGEESGWQETTTAGLMYLAVAPTAMWLGNWTVGLLAECRGLGIRSASHRSPMTHTQGPEVGGEVPYRPAWWLANRHAHTLWGRFARRVPSVPARRELWDTPDGDVLEVDR